MIFYKSFFKSIIFVFLSISSYAISGPVYDSLDDLINQVDNDITDLAIITDRSLVISASTSDLFKQDLKTQFLRKLFNLRIEGKSLDFRFLECIECFTAKGRVVGRKVIVKRGITKKEDLKTITEKYGAKTYTRLELTYTGLQIILSVSMFNLKNDPIWSKTYKTRLLLFSETGFTISLTFYQTVALEQDGFPLAADIFFGERIYSFGKLGLYLHGSYFSTTIPTYLSIGTMFAWNLNQSILPSSLWASVLLVGKAGIGISISSGIKRDITVGGGLRIELGYYFHISVETIYGIYINDNSAQSNEHYPLSIIAGFGVNLW